VESLCDLFLPVIRPVVQSQAVWEHDSLSNTHSHPETDCWRSFHRRCGLATATAAVRGRRSQSFHQLSEVPGIRGKNFATIYKLIISAETRRATADVPVCLLCGAEGRRYSHVFRHFRLISGSCGGGGGGGGTHQSPGLWRGRRCIHPGPSRKPTLCLLPIVHRGAQLDDGIASVIAQLCSVAIR